jgi:hypothetical protein
MGSLTALPHQGSNKADALSAELQGHISNGSRMLARQRTMSNAITGNKKEIAMAGDLFDGH